MADEGVPTTYEERLSADLEWAMADAGEFLRGRGTVHDTLQRITARLDELGIAYAVAGGMALFGHGYRRFTEDVDLLVTREGLARIHEQLVGRGYRPKFEGSRHLRDTVSGVTIEFLVTGQYPGDGRPQAVAFPDPAECSLVRAGVAYLNLEALVELKLAAAISAPDRYRDLGDVVELIDLLDLPAEFDRRLNPVVREKYAELHQAAQSRRHRGGPDK